jgi:two-component system nitrogen regulation sensor histidine kinase NtrY
MTSKANTSLTKQRHLSLESQLKWAASSIFVIVISLLLLLMATMNLTWLEHFTLLTFIIIPFGIWLSRLYQKIITPFYSLTNLVEAIRLEDYSLRPREQYSSGIIHSLVNEISELSDELQQRKQTYDQHSLLVNHLIEQLDAPIAIFNNKHQLHHANAAFSKYIGQAWKTQRLTSSQKLGFTLQQHWQFIDQNEANRWQIKQSQFIQNEQHFHLVILTNIETLLRVNQQKSWQQIIRVLSHEIRNSLTPIKSLAQTLVSLPSQDERSTQALNVIVERSISLQDFVNRYGDISKNLVVNKVQIDANNFINDIISIFPTMSVKVDSNIEYLLADPVLLKQVVINLIKNAIESCVKSPQTEIIIRLYQRQQNNEKLSIIEVIDSGQGIANIDNLFVPFYTTKSNGHGIGLGLCQNIIEHHNGRLSLTNNGKSEGATATITLPT